VVKTGLQGFERAGGGSSIEHPESSIWTEPDLKPQIPDF